MAYPFQNMVHIERATNLEEVPRPRYKSYARIARQDMSFLSLKSKPDLHRFETSWIPILACSIQCVPNLDRE